MEWDTSLAEKAKAYADLLLKKTLENDGELTAEIWKHDPKNKEGEGMGENLYYGDGKKGTADDFCVLADEAW